MDNISSEFKEIKLDSLMGGSKLKVDIYIYNTDRNSCVLYYKKGKIFDDEHKDFLRKRKKKLYVTKEDFRYYLDYLKGNLIKIIDNKNIESKEKNTYFYTASKEIMSNMFLDTEDTENIEISRDLSKSSTDIIFDQETKFKDVLDLMSVDYFTYTHSINVSLLSVNFARILGIERKKIELISLGALMHDIGKSRISKDILLKTSQLNEKEWEEIKKHSEYGELIMLETEKKFDELVYKIIRNHHEKYNGKGYPDKIDGDEIPLEVQIVSMSDVFDALTTNRCYNASVSTFDALTIMKNEMEGSFEPNLLKRFIAMFGYIT